MFFEGLSGNALVSFAVKPLYFALFQVGCVWAEIPSCGCAWEYTLRGTHLRDGSVRSVPQETWTLKFILQSSDPPLPLSCPSPFLFCPSVLLSSHDALSSQQPHCVQKLVGGAVAHLLLPVGVVRVSPLLSLFDPKACSGWTHTELNHFFLSGEINGFST